MGKFHCTPDMVMCGQLPSAENMERWKKYIQRENEGHGHETIEAIFNLALLGLDKAKAAEHLAADIAADRLREIAKGLKDNKRNLK